MAVKKLVIPVALWLLCLTVAPAPAAVTDLPEAARKHLESLPDDLTRLEWLRAEVAKKPGDIPLNFALGNTAFDAQQLADAVTAYKKVIELDPKIVGAHVNLGSVYDEMGRLDEALQSYAKALEIDPREDRTLCNMGNVYFKKRMNEQAIERFQQALKINPKSQLAHYNLAILFADSGMYREAIREWEACVAIDPGSDLGTRSRDNVGIVRQMMDAEMPELQDQR